jgi:transcriptional regulator with XRE-family HTH domain
MIDDVKLYKAVGATIKQLRQKQNLNQDEFGKRIGLERTSVTNIEHGRQKVTVETLYRISESFELESISSLLPSIKDVLQDKHTVTEQKEITSGASRTVVGTKTFDAIQRRR